MVIPNTLARLPQVQVLHFGNRIQARRDFAALQPTGPVGRNNEEVADDPLYSDELRNHYEFQLFRDEGERTLKDLPKPLAAFKEAMTEFRDKEIGVRDLTSKIKKMFSRRPQDPIHADLVSKFNFFLPPLNRIGGNHNVKQPEYVPPFDFKLLESVCKTPAEFDMLRRQINSKSRRASSKSARTSLKSSRASSNSDEVSSSFAGTSSNSAGDSFNSTETLRRLLSSPSRPISPYPTYPSPFDLIRSDFVPTPSNLALTPSNLALTPSNLALTPPKSTKARPTVPTGRKTSTVVSLPSAFTRASSRSSNSSSPSAEALLFREGIKRFKLIKERLRNNAEIYNKFLEILDNHGPAIECRSLDHLQTQISKEILEDVCTRVRVLLKNYTDLTMDLAKFLPSFLFLTRNVSKLVQLRF